MHLQRKAIHQPGQFHSFVIEPSHQLRELLLGGDHQPHLAASDPAEVLNHGLKIEHLLHISSHELTHLIHHKQKRFAGATAQHQLHAALGQITRSDVGPLHGRFPPAVGRGIGGRLQLVHHTAGLLHRNGDQAFARIPILAKDLLVLGLEGSQFTRFFQGDFQLREVEIPCIAQALQEEPVHDLRNTLIARTDPPICGDIKDHRLGGDLLSDARQQNLGFRIADALGQPNASPFTRDGAVL